MSVRFKGVLGVIGKTTRDGRRLAPHDPAAGPLTRDLPILIISPGYGPAGRIESVWVDGDLIRYSGRLDDLAAAHVREKLQVAGLDVDRAVEQPGSGDDLVLAGWRIVGGDPGPVRVPGLAGSRNGAGGAVSDENEQLPTGTGAQGGGK